MVVLALVAGLVLGGCGASAPEPIEGRPDVGAVQRGFTAVTGIPLVRADGDGETTLSPALTGRSLARFGGFTIHLAENADVRKALLVDEYGDPLRQNRERRWRSELDGSVVEDYGRGVVVASSPVPLPGDGKATSEPVFHRALAATLARDPSAVPEAERRCPQRGAMGTCVLNGATATLAGPDRTVATDDARATLRGTAVTDELPVSTDDRDEARTDGRFLVVRYRSSPARRAEDVYRGGLQVGRRTYSSSPLNLQLVPDVFRLRGRIRDVVLVFAIPREAIAPALRDGALVLPAPDRSTSASSRIPLAGAPRLTLEEAVRP